MSYGIKGELIIIGGAEDKSGSREILRRVANMIDKEKDTMIVSTLASDLGREVGYDYKNLFHELGVKNIEILDISSRDQCDNRDLLDMVKKASLIFFTGGNQLKITSLVGGTPLYEEMRKFHDNGGIFAGTSAGASVMSETMIVRGPDEESPRKNNLSKCP
ncbi:cyanophycinase, partial [Candidatus Arthromitus sp. SFB-3]